MQIPKKIKYGVYEYKVRLEDDPMVGDDQVWGYFDSGNMEIVLRKDLHEQMIATTLFHELAHMILAHSGFVVLEEYSECLANIFGYGWYQLMVQNKGLFEDGGKTTKTNN